MRDAVIVLSHRREPDGGLSNEYIGRLEKGIKLVLGGKAENLVLCSETATEDVKKYVIKKGISEENIVLQSKSKDTVGEAFFTKKFLFSKGWKSVFVVSSDYHLLYRAALIFDFILGKGYNVEYLYSKSDRLKDSATIIDQIESLKAFFITFEEVEPGDDLAIEKRIFEKHKLYSRQDGE